MAYTAWRGAIELNGFPVNVQLFGRVKDRKGISFRQLDPKHKQPVTQQLVDIKGKVVNRDTLLKGVPNGETFVALNEDQATSIASAERSGVLTPDSFSPLASIDLSLAISTYAVRGDSKVAGSEKSVQTLWNGLHDMGLAYVSTITMRSGSRDAIIVFYATDTDLLAATLPFQAELNDVPAFVPQANSTQADLFRLVVGDDIAPFDLTAFESEYAARRDAAVEAALKGKKVAPKKVAPKKEAAPSDLEAALMASLAAKDSGSSPKKATSRKKAA